jgi:hypothetical protein
MLRIRTAPALPADTAMQADTVVVNVETGKGVQHRIGFCVAARSSSSNNQ